MASFVIDDYYELLALHRAIMEAKFGGGVRGPVDGALAGSPFVAAIGLRVVDSLVQAEGERGALGKGQDWRSWQAASRSRIEWGIAVGQARAIAEWQSWTEPVRAEHARVLLAPLTLTDDALAQFMNDVADGISTESQD